LPPCDAHLFAVKGGIATAGSEIPPFVLVLAVGTSELFPVFAAFDKIVS